MHTKEKNYFEMTENKHYEISTQLNDLFNKLKNNDIDIQSNKNFLCYLANNTTPTLGDYKDNFAGHSVFTDVSKTKQHVGSAFVVYNRNKRFIYQAYYHLHFECNIVFCNHEKSGIYR